MAKILKTQFKLRRANRTEWEEKNPVLAAGEPGVELDTHKLKLGDGLTAWNNLPYAAGGSYEAGAGIDISNDAISVKTDGETVKLNSNGELSAEMPIASTASLGGIKVGENLSIEEDGTLNATGGETCWEPGEGEHSAQTIGTGCQALGDNTVAEGINTIATSDYSHAEGYASKTVIDPDDPDGKGRASHAEGTGTVAKGTSSHAEGGGTLARGADSHAEGNSTSAMGGASHAEGNWTITNNLAEHAEGTFNLSNKASDTFGNAGNTLHSVGIGHSTGELQDDRKNAFEIMQNGDAYLIGVGNYDGTNPNEAQTLQAAVNAGGGSTEAPVIYYSYEEVIPTEAGTYYIKNEDGEYEPYEVTDPEHLYPEETFRFDEIDPSKMESIMGMLAIYKISDTISNADLIDKVVKITTDGGETEEEYTITEGNIVEEMPGFTIVAINYLDQRPMILVNGKYPSMNIDGFYWAVNLNGGEIPSIYLTEISFEKVIKFYNRTQHKTFADWDAESGTDGFIVNKPFYKKTGEKEVLIYDVVELDPEDDDYEKFNPDIDYYRVDGDKLVLDTTVDETSVGTYFTTAPLVDCFMSEVDEDTKLISGRYYCHNTDYKFRSIPSLNGYLISSSDGYTAAQLVVGDTVNTYFKGQLYTDVVKLESTSGIKYIGSDKFVNPNSTSEFPFTILFAPITGTLGSTNFYWDNFGENVIDVRNYSDLAVGYAYYIGSTFYSDPKRVYFTDENNVLTYEDITFTQVDGKYKAETENFIIEEINYTNVPLDYVFLDGNPPSSYNRYLKVTFKKISIGSTTSGEKICNTYLRMVAKYYIDAEENPPVGSELRYFPANIIAYPDSTEETIKDEKMCDEFYMYKGDVEFYPNSGIEMMYNVEKVTEGSIIEVENGNEILFRSKLELIKPELIIEKGLPAEVAEIYKFLVANIDPKAFIEGLFGDRFDSLMGNPFIYFMTHKDSETGQYAPYYETGLSCPSVNVYAPESRNPNIKINIMPIEIKKIDPEFLPEMQSGSGITAGVGIKSEVFNGVNPQHATGDYSHVEGYIDNEKTINIEDGLLTYKGEIDSEFYWDYKFEINDIDFYENYSDTIEDYGVIVINNIPYYGEMKTAHAAYKCIKSYNDHRFTFKIHSQDLGQYIYYISVDDTFPAVISQGAIGGLSHVEGAYNIALGSCSHVEGDYNIGFSESSHTEGAGNINGGNYSHVEGYENKSDNRTINHIEGEFNKAGDENFTESIGGYDPSGFTGRVSHVEGTANTALNNSHVEGYSNLSISSNSHTEGLHNINNGYSSHIEGRNNISLGEYSHSEGDTTVGWSLNLSSDSEANYDFSVTRISETVFKSTQTQKYYEVYLKLNYYKYLEISESESKNIGFNGIGRKNYGVIVRISNLDRDEDGKMVITINSEDASKISSDWFAIGDDSISKGATLLRYYNAGNYSHIEGTDNEVSLGEFSHIEGWENKSVATGSHIEGGRNTVGSTYFSHIEGTNNISLNGHYQHTEGHNRIAYGEYSHVEGAGSGYDDITYDALQVNVPDSEHLKVLRYKVNTSSSNLPLPFPYFEKTNHDRTVLVFEKTNTGFRDFEDSILLGELVITDITVEELDENYYQYDFEFNESGFDFDINKTYLIGYVDYNGDGAFGDNSHAEGCSTKTTGIAAHAEGIGTSSLSNGSHSEGTMTFAVGVNSHAEGYGTFALGKHSHAEGYFSDDLYTIESAQFIDEHTLRVDGELSQSIRYFYDLIETCFIKDDYESKYETEKCYDKIYYYGGKITSIEYKKYDNIDEVQYSICTVELNKTIDIEKIKQNHEFIFTTMQIGATGIASHTEGAHNNALGDASHAEGSGSKAIGDASHAEGSAVAEGANSHAEGSFTLAANVAHSEGQRTGAFGAASHAEGIGVPLESKCFIQKATVIDSTTIKLDQHVDLVGNDNEIILLSEGLFVARASVLSWNNITYTVEEMKNVPTGEYTAVIRGFWLGGAFGEASHVEGYVTTAEGRFSHAEGVGTLAKGDYSHAEGANNVPSGQASHTEGANTQALGEYSHAEGYKTQAQLEGSHSEGMNTQALGAVSHAECFGTFAGVVSHAEGFNTIAAGRGTHAEGWGKDTEDIIITTQVELIDSSTLKIKDLQYLQIQPGYSLIIFTDGWGIGGEVLSRSDDVCTVKIYDFVTERFTNEDNTYFAIFRNFYGGAFGTGSHSEGHKTTTYGLASHAEGMYTMAKGETSHAEGNRTQAYGKFSHGEGAASVAYGIGSHAEGCCSFAFGQGAHAEGASGGTLQEYTLKCTAINENIATFTYITDAPRISTQDTVIFIVGSENYHYTPLTADYDNLTFEAQSWMEINVEYRAVPYTCGAIGDYSHTQGSGTTALNNNQTAMGCFNDSKENDGALLYVGNGTDLDNRHNAFVVTADGGIILPASDDPTKYFKITVNSNGEISATTV